VALLAVALIFANLLGQRFFLRIDGTADGRYRLSAASRNLVRTLPDPLTIRFFLTAGLPQPYESQGRYVRDLLQEYRTASRGRVRVEIVHPERDPAKKNDAGRVGIAPARFTEVASDQFQVREGYLGLSLSYQDKSENIPFIRDVNSLEYDLSSRIRKMTSTGRKTILLVQGHNEVSPDVLKQNPVMARLFEDFQVEPVRLSTESYVKPDAVLVVGPQAAIPPAEIALLDGYLADGVPMAVFMNRRVVYTNNLRSMAQTTGLEPWLEHYGVMMDRDFVMDFACQRISMQTGAGNFLVSYPPYPMASRFSKDHVLTKTLDVLGFPFVHPVTAVPGSALQVTPLAWSSEKSWQSPGLYNLDPPSLKMPTDADPKGPFPLMAEVRGATTTFSSPSRPVKDLRLIVAGTGFLVDPRMPSPEGNGLFLINLAQWMTQDGELLAIPPKGSPFRPLRPLGTPARIAVKWGGQFGLPLLVFAAAILHWRRRRRQREIVRAEFRPEAPRA
jgi:ABC-type uncharacterized transport system involved in gliding motility auxiliary subunit